MGPTFTKSTADKDLLTQPFTKYEIQLALKDLPNTNAPGPDGMQGIFLKFFWHIMKSDIMDFFSKFAGGEIDMHELNYIYMVLIPKIKQVERIFRFSAY